MTTIKDVAEAACESVLLERAELDAATAKLLEVAEKMADGCTVGNFGPLQNRLRARSKAVRALRAKLGIKP